MPQNTADLFLYKSLDFKFKNLHIYASLREDPILGQAARLFETLAKESRIEDCFSAASAFLRKMIQHSKGLIWSDYLILRIIDNVNPFSRYFAEKHHEDSYGKWLTEVAALDLNELQSLANFSLNDLSDRLRSWAIADSNTLVLQQLQNVPTWPEHFGSAALREQLAFSDTAYKVLNLFKDAMSEPRSWQRLAKVLSYYHAANACGVLCFNRVFHWQNDANQPLLPLTSEQQTQDESLYDYTATLQKLRANTERFLAGKSAENALLYGPRGTGKSTSVRLMIKQYAKNGLRMIELGRKQLAALPQIFAFLHSYSLRFIIFIDDLSFDEMNEDFTLFKNVLDGSILRQADNVLIYVTSNRRHLVSENFVDTDNALYANDVRSERLSLAERFGLRLRFTTPNKTEYLALIKHVLREQGRELNAEQMAALEKSALADSANEASMTPRNAMRFLRDYLAKGESDV